MSDLISRQAAIEALQEVSEHYTEKGIEWHPHVDFMVWAIKELPSAERKGKWLYHESIDAFECSVCGRQMVRNIFYYCPWCGAIMRGEENDNM